MIRGIPIFSLEVHGAITNLPYLSLFAAIVTLLLPFNSSNECQVGNRYLTVGAPVGYILGMILEWVVWPDSYLPLIVTVVFSLLQWVAMITRDGLKWTNLAVDGLIAMIMIGIQHWYPFPTVAGVPSLFLVVMVGFFLWKICKGLVATNTAYPVQLGLIYGICSIGQLFAAFSGHARSEQYSDWCVVYWILYAFALTVEFITCVWSKMGIWKASVSLE